MIDIKWLLRAARLLTHEQALLVEDLIEIVNNPRRQQNKHFLTGCRKEVDALIAQLQAIDEKLTDAIVELEQGDTTVSGKRVLKYPGPDDKQNWY